MKKVAKYIGLGFIGMTAFGAVLSAAGVKSTTKAAVMDSTKQAPCEERDECVTDVNKVDAIMSCQTAFQGLVSKDLSFGEEDDFTPNFDRHLEVRRVTADMKLPHLVERYQEDWNKEYGLSTPELRAKFAALPVGAPIRVRYSGQDGMIQNAFGKAFRRISYTCDYSLVAGRAVDAWAKR